MKVRVLGSSAGGGFPQWNCSCSNCLRQREGTLKAPSRTQSSIAVSNDGEPGKWLLLNASPDLATQLSDWPQAHPKGSVRGSPICGVALIDSQIDHCAGLLSLRESKELKLYCTHAAYEDLDNHFAILKVLEPYCKIRHYSVEEDLPWFANGVSELAMRAIFVSGKSPPYSPHREHPTAGSNIALEITDERTGKKLLYAPGVEIVDDKLSGAMANVDCIMIDGTFWTDDEMDRHGISQKRAKEMGHLSLSEKGGMLDQLKQYPNARRIFIHINNTNPILDPQSEERKLVESLGIEVAYDGMEFEV